SRPKRQKPRTTIRRRCRQSTKGFSKGGVFQAGAGALWRPKTHVSCGRHSLASWAPPCFSWLPPFALGARTDRAASRGSRESRFRMVVGSVLLGFCLEETLLP